MSRFDKSIVTEGRLVIAGGWREGMCGVTTNRMGLPFGVMEMFRHYTVGAVASPHQ